MIGAIIAHYNDMQMIKKSFIIHIFLTLAFIGCDSGTISPGEYCEGDECNQTYSDGMTSPNQDGGTTLSDSSVSQCSKDEDCADPFVCHLASGQCVPPSAKDTGLCDPIEGQGCSDGLECVNGICLEPLDKCESNDDCPTGYICISGVCTPDGGSGGCTDNSQCPADTVCVAGICAPEDACTKAHATDRLAGTWNFNSSLKVRDGLEGMMSGILSIASTLQDMLDGKFSIPGIPSFLDSIVASLIKDVIDDYTQPWAKQLIGWLASMDDAIDEWKIQSTETFVPVAANIYQGTSVWNTISFEYQGAFVSVNPKDVPGMGEISVTSYSARDVCGTLLIDRHKVKNKIGKIFRWAVEAILLKLACNDPQIPCYQTLEEMFNDTVDCKAFANALATGQLSSYASTIEAACNSQKSNIVKMLISELDDLAANLTTMSLSAKATIPDHAKTLDDGRWYGVLGFTYGKGNFEGSFTAQKQ